MSRLRRLSVLVLTLFLMGVATSSFAQDISVTAEVDTHTVQAGSPVLFMITVNGTQSVEPVELPDIKGFEARYLGPRTQLSIVNGKSASSISFMYNLYAMEVGHFQIPAIPIAIDSKTYTTEPVNIEVVAQATTSSGDQGSQVSVKDKVFLVLSVPTKEYFVNEKIPLTIRLYASQEEQVNLASNIDFKREGFDIDQILDSRRGQQTIGNETFDVLEFSTSIYPQRAGEFTLGPAQLLCKILVKSSRRSPFQDMPSVFNDDFFNNFFSQEWRDLMVKSADISLKVLPVPQEGKPQDFSGGVGKFDFEVSVSPAELKVGDPLTWRMKISGDGSLKNINFPPVSDPRFKFYEPQVHEDKGEKTLEQVVIPTTDAVKEFPAVSFSYFDTEARQYKTVAKGPFPLKVAKADTESVKISPASGPQPAEQPKPEEEKLGQDISFIKDSPGTFRPSGYQLYERPVFLIAVFLSFCLWIIAFVMYRLTHRLKTDTAFARHFLAPRKAKKELDQAKVLLGSGDQKKFYDQLFRVIQDYVSSKAHRKPAAMNMETVKELLKNKNMKTELIDDIQGLFQECEMVRFASVQVTKEKMQASFLKVEEIIDHLERNWS